MADAEERLRQVEERIAAVAERTRRDPAEIRLIAVSKTFGADHVRAAASLDTTPIMKTLD